MHKMAASLSYNSRLVTQWACHKVSYNSVGYDKESAIFRRQYRLDSRRVVYRLDRSRVVCQAHQTQVYEVRTFHQTKLKLYFALLLRQEATVTDGQGDIVSRVGLVYTTPLYFTVKYCTALYCIALY